MSDASKPVVPAHLLPPGVKDRRQDAFVAMLDDALAAISLDAMVMTNMQTVDARLLPFLVREFSMQEFIVPDLKEQYVRNLLERAYELHAAKGYVYGTRMALEALGARVEWTQWWQEEPKAAHNTHKVKVFFGDVLFDGNAFADTLGDPRHRSAATRIIEATKRWSQSIAVEFGVFADSVLKVGAAALTGATYTASLTYEAEPAPVDLFPAALAMMGGTFTAKLENA